MIGLPAKTLFLTAAIIMGLVADAKAMPLGAELVTQASDTPSVENVRETPRHLSPLD